MFSSRPSSRTQRLTPRNAVFALLAAAGFAASAHAAEHIVLRNGFDLICDHRENTGDKVRLYTDAAGSSFLEVAAGDIVSDEHVDLPKLVTAPKATTPGPPPVPERLTDADLAPLLTKAGTAFNVDADLLASVVREESNGHTHAVSTAGAQGLMQLMPGTASDLGVADSFAPGENIQGGTAYLNALLVRYNDNLALALAAYNAGPAAVDRCHGIPPYRETRVYVARVIREYNRRYALRHPAELRSSAAH
jgi:soluble lytic murein transglycosylase-like protein